MTDAVDMLTEPATAVFTWDVRPGREEAFESGHGQGWPLVPRGLLFPLIMAPLLTYPVMPALGRVLRRWLYPKHRSHPPARPD